MIERKDKKRLICMDVAKGIGIILMIIGHMPIVPEAIRMWIYSFHMPLFLVVSGYFFRNVHPLVCLKKSFKQLVIPYIIYSILFISIDSVIFRDGNLMASELKRFCIGQGGADVLWFFICLFLVKNIFCFIYYYVKNKKVIILCCIALSFGGEFISESFLGNLFKVSAACYSVSLFGIGYLLSKKIHFKEEFSYWNFFKFLLLMIFNYILLGMNSFLGFDGLDMNNLHFGFLPVSMLAAICGSFGIIVFSDCISQTKVANFLAYIGNNTLFFFPLMTYMPTRLVNIFELFTLKTSSSLLKIISKLASGIFTVLICEIYNRKK